MSEEQKELSVACQSLGDWTRTHSFFNFTETVSFYQFTHYFLP